MKVWLDDTRPAPPGWVWMTRVRDVIAALRAEEVDEVSLDYNLTQTDPKRDGLDVLKWLYKHPSCPLPVIHFHTANAWGGARMAWYWRALEGRCKPTEQALLESMGLE